MPDTYTHFRIDPDVGRDIRDVNRRMRATTGKRVTLSETFAELVRAWRHANARWPGLPDFDDHDTSNSVDES